MKKVENTYSNRATPSRAKSRPGAKRTGSKTATARSLPSWTPYAAAGLLTVLICLTVNFRAYTELSTEIEQHEGLNQEIENLTNENLAIQEEIYYLKSDSGTVEREAKKFGLIRPDKKVSVPATK